MTSKSGSKARSQSEKFKEAAREVEADDDEKAFEERLRNIASQPPSKPDTPRSKKKNPAK